MPRPQAPLPAARPATGARPAAGTRPATEARPARSRPDPNPLRVLYGFLGIASASAIASALLPSVAPRVAAADTAAARAPQPSVVHVTRVVQLAPGQTAPPQAQVLVQPTPTPRVHVVTTRQSGKP